VRWRVEVRNKTEIPDSIGDGVKKDIGDLGISGVLAVETMQVYIIEGDVSSPLIKKSRKIY